MARFRGRWLPALFTALWNGCSTPRDSSPGAGVAGAAPPPPRGDSVPPGDVEIGRFRDGFVIRGRTTRPAVRPGAERGEFLAAAARALEVDAARLELDAPIMAAYGADELQVYECIQRAEDIWRVQLLPSRIPVREFSAALTPFGTLGAIITAAEAASRAQGPR